jgi:hypothetical protein
MARIDPVTAGRGGLRVRLAYFFTDRMLARLAGRKPPGDPATAVGMYAYSPACSPLTAGSSRQRASSG